MKLIPNAKSSHKMWSVRLAVLAAMFGALELTLPLWQGIVPPQVFAAMSTACALSAAVARVVKQSNLEV